MAFVRTFEDFSPPPRFDGLPFVSVEIQEGATQDGPFTPIETLALIPTDADPANPQSRDLTTANAILDPAWYVLVWADNANAFFPSEPISSIRRSFVSAQDLGNFLDRDDLIGNDAVLDVIDSACDMCRTFTEQTLTLVHDDVVTLDGSGTDALLLPERPVNEVALVTIDGEAIDNWVLNAEGILLRTRTTVVSDWSDWPWFASLVWPPGRQNVQITYSHGYANVPADLQAVARNYAARLFTQGPSGSVASETLGAYSVTYNTSRTAGSLAFDLTPTEKMILRKYKMAKSF